MVRITYIHANQRIIKTGGWVLTQYLPLGTNCLSIARMILVSMMSSNLFVITAEVENSFPQRIK